jgi:hypothetical protein
VAVTQTPQSCTERQRYLCANLFAPLSKTLLTDGEIEFNRLGTSKLSLVRISPTRAVRIAESQYGRGPGTRMVFESLGGYIDKNQIIPDWVGTRSMVPKAVPTYLVRFHDDRVVTVEPSRNHYWNVIVNATNGEIIAAFTYD